MAGDTDKRQCAWCGEGDYPKEDGPINERVCATYDRDDKPYHPSCLAQKVNYRGKSGLHLVSSDD